MHPDPAKRRHGEARMEFYIANWKRVGCPVISTETGTFNRTSEWLDAPENATEQGYAQCRAAFDKLARAAEKSGAIISIEAYWRNFIGSIERAARRRLLYLHSARSLDDVAPVKGGSPVSIS